MYPVNVKQNWNGSLQQSTFSTPSQIVNIGNLDFLLKSMVFGKGTCCKQVDKIACTRKMNLLFLTCLTTLVLLTFH